jgi:hypothetical protein
MATATAPAPVTPMSAWDDAEIALFTTPASMAGCVAWDVLAHLQGHGADLARIHEMRLPAGCEAENMQDFLWSLVTEAGEIGYRIANIDVKGSVLPFAGAQLTQEDVARAVIALLRQRPVEDDEAFDPEWAGKRDARDAARAVA